MKGLCGIGIEQDRLSCLLVACVGNRFNPISEVVLDVASSDLLQGLKDNIENLEVEIKEKEKAYSVEIDKVYCRLPLDWGKAFVVEDVYPLTSNEKKLIRPRDIYNAKRQIEDVSLEWNELCLHNIILEYQIDDKVYLKLPPSIEGRRLRLKSMLVSIEKKIFKETEEIFENIGRKFMGFVYSPFSDIGIQYKKDTKEYPYVVINIGKDKTICSGIINNHPFWETFEFGEEKVKKCISSQYLLPSEVSSEILNRHLSLYNVTTRKEVLIKDGANYVNLSMDSLNSLARKLITQDLTAIIESLRKRMGHQFKALFIGRLTSIKGFSNFLRDNFPYLELETTHFNFSCTDLLGCVRYGQYKFLEVIPLSRERRSWWEYILSIYRDYF
jgi:cell division ATPase FtsA